MLDKLADLARDFEKKTGAPPLSKLTETLEKFPDTTQLKLIKETLEVADRISSKVGDLSLGVELIKAMGSVSIDQLREWQVFLKQIERILKKAPQDLVQFLLGLKEK